MNNNHLGLLSLVFCHFPFWFFNQFRESSPKFFSEQALSIISVSLLAVENLSDFSPVFFTGVLEVMPLILITWKHYMDTFIIVILTHLVFYFSGCSCCSLYEYLHCWFESVVWHWYRQGRCCKFTGAVAMIWEIRIENSVTFWYFKGAFH